MPVVLLIAALLLFLLSTRQWKIWVRLIAWLTGVVALAIGIQQLVNWAGSGVAAGWQVLGASANLSIWSALVHNWQTVGSAFNAMMPAFLGLAVLFGLLTLIAFTPGQTVERIIRPLIVALIGLIGGAALSLTAVALGLGGYLKPREYIFSGASAEVIDGDTLRVGNTSLRLDDLDAPELTQTCLLQSQRVPCGVRAAEHLEGIISGRTIVCRRKDNDSTIPPEESFGRPIVACEFVHGGAAVNLSDQMITDGWAVRYVDANHDDDLHSVRIGGACTLHPATWRHDRQSRAEFNRVVTEPARCPSSGNPR